VERLLQEFERTITDAAGATYRVFLWGRSRPADTWQGWLVFERLTDGHRFTTDVETTQPNAEALLYWATGLSNAYFDGALERAKTPHRHPQNVVVPEPIVSAIGDSASRRQRLADVERAVLASFTGRRITRLLTRTLLDDLPYAHADVVRALEDLEKRGGLLVRRTEEGNDWLFLTTAGAEAAGVATVPTTTMVVERERAKPR
jgi:hypothetical protein